MGKIPMMSHSLRIAFLATVMAVFISYLAVPESMDAADMAALAPAAGGDIAAHKALYAFKMVSVEPGIQLSGISGKMYYEQDDVCDAWTTDNRYTLEYHYAEGQPLITASHFVSWEAKDGTRFSFNSERQEAGEVTELLRGSAVREEGGAGKAAYVRPEDLSFDLPEGYFLPMAHTFEMIRRAKAGERFFSGVLFDGTDAEGPVEVNTFIGKKATAEEIAAHLKDNEKVNEKISGALLTPDAWHVRIAVFSLKEKEAISPVYEMDTILHDNGVISWSLVNYKTFKIEQKLSALEEIPAKACP